MELKLRLYIAGTPISELLFLILMKYPLMPSLYSSYLRVDTITCTVGTTALHAKRSQHWIDW